MRRTRQTIVRGERVTTKPCLLYLWQHSHIQGLAKILQQKCLYNRGTDMCVSETCIELSGYFFSLPQRHQRKQPANRNTVSQCKESCDAETTQNSSTIPAIFSNVVGISTPFMPNLCANLHRIDRQNIQNHHISLEGCMSSPFPISAMLGRLCF